MYKTALLFGIFFCLFGVIIGAFGAHYLKSIISSEGLKTFEVGVRYQFYHGFALIFSGVLYIMYKNKFIYWATYSFAIGIFLFSGSIYLLSILKETTTIGLSAIGVLTPMGGLCFAAGWLFLFIAIQKK